MITSMQHVCLLVVQVVFIQADTQFYLADNCWLMTDSFAWISFIILFLSLPGQGIQKLTARISDNVVLPCDVPLNSSEHVVAWHKAGIVVPIFVRFNAFPPYIEEAFQGRIKSALNPTSLEIDQVKSEDNGSYQCSIVFFGSSDGRGIGGTPIELIVLAPPTLTEASPSFLNHILGETIDLMCVGNGVPRPNVSWLKDGLHVLETNRLSISQDKITISQLSTSDAGTYTCTLENGSGRISHSIKLDVEGKNWSTSGTVNIIIPPRNITAALGSRVKLECQAEGSSRNITYQWYFNNEDVQRTPGLLERSGIYADGSFVITTAMKRDMGWYKCQPSNGLEPAASAQAFLNVTYPPKTLNMASRKYAIRGMRMELGCPVDANPPIRKTLWTKNEAIVEFSSRVWTSMSGSLMFDEILHSDGGNYSCLPFSSIGPGRPSGPVQVLVKEAPHFITRPVIFIQKRVGETIELKCESQADPPAINTWKKIGDLMFQDRSRIKMDGGNITIKNLSKEDQGMYECHASNTIVTSVASTILFVQEKEFHGAYNLKVFPYDHTAKLSWLPGLSFGGQLNYVVWFRTLENVKGFWQTLRVVPDGTLSVTIHGLIGGNSYEFMIQSRDELDREDFSETVIAEIKEVFHTRIYLETPQRNSTCDSLTTLFTIQMLDEATTHSLDFQILVLRGQMTSQGLNLSWIHHNSDDTLSHYSIYYRTVGKWLQLVNNLPSNVTNFLWTTASRGTTYHFMIYGYFLGSSSNISCTVLVDTTDALSRPIFQTNLAILPVAPVLIMTVIFILLVSRTRRKKLRRKCERYGTIKYFGPNQGDESRLRMTTKRIYMDGLHLPNSDKTSSFKETPI